MAAKLTLLAGMPTAGKTTYANSHFDAATIVSYDLMGEYYHGCDNVTEGNLQALMRAIVKARLDAGGDTVVDATNLMFHERSRWGMVAEGCAAEIHLIFLHIPLALAARRNAGRGKNAFDVETLTRMHDKSLDFLHAFGNFSGAYDSAEIVLGDGDGEFVPDCPSCQETMYLVADDYTKIGSSFYCNRCDIYQPLSHPGSPLGLIFGEKSA